MKYTLGTKLIEDHCIVQYVPLIQAKVLKCDQQFVHTDVHTKSVQDTVLFICQLNDACSTFMSILLNSYFSFGLYTLFFSYMENYIFLCLFVHWLIERFDIKKQTPEVDIEQVSMLTGEEPPTRVSQVWNKPSTMFTKDSARHRHQTMNSKHHLP
jgi:hypothetical protein